MRNADRLLALVLLGSGILHAQAPRPDPHVAQLNAAAQFLQQGKTGEAIRECKSVLSADPRSAPAHLLLALAYLALGTFDRVADAKAELQQAIYLDPDLLLARFHLARLYLDQGQNEKAQTQLESGLKQRPGFPEFLALLGETRRRSGDPGASLELNRKALAADASIAPAHYYLALAHIDLNQNQAAMAEFEKAIRSAYATPDLYNAMASLYLKARQFDDAEEACRRAIALDRSRPDAYLILARVYNAQRASDKALEALRGALPEGREIPVTEYYGELQADVAVERGVAYSAKKLYAQAIEAYASALEFDPRRAVIHRRLAELYRQQGNPAAAARHAKEADRIEKGEK